MLTHDYLQLIDFNVSPEQKNLYKKTFFSPSVFEKDEKEHFFNLTSDEILKNKNQEKRKRNQAYYALDYILSSFTYFDYFSLDAFQIAINSKYLTQICNKKVVTSEFLLLAFFCSYSELSSIFDNFDLNTLVQKMAYKFPELEPKKTINSQILTFFKLSFNYLNKEIKSIRNFNIKELNLFLKKSVKSEETVYSSIFKQDIKFNDVIIKLFEKASENAISRFKTPIISSEILFLTLLEEKELKIGQIIQKHIFKEIDWYLLRYALLKKLHKQESFIKNELPKSQYFFAYLLKSRLSDFEFNQLIEKKTLSQAVFSFRNNLIKNVLEIDLSHLLLRDIYYSLKVTGYLRTYSHEV